MSVRYHINPETGEVGLCRANIKCRFLLDESKHYPTANLAREAYEKTQETFKKKKPVSLIIRKISKREFVRELEGLDSKLKSDLMDRFDESGDWTPFKVGDKLFVNREFPFKNKKVFSLQEISFNNDERKIYLSVMGTVDVDSDGKKTLEINDLDNELKPIVEGSLIQKNILKYSELNPDHKRTIDSFLKLPYTEGSNDFDAIYVNIIGSNQRLTFLKS